jgi:hypothetical protein
MTGMLLSAPVFRAVDSNGAPMPGALLQFYVTGTTTPTSVYTSSALTTALSNPVVADAGGLFPAIYLDPTVTYRAQLLTAASVLVKDIDPLSTGVIEATLAQVNAGSATGIYVSPAKLAAWTGVAGALGYAPLNKAGDTATNLLITNTALATSSAGYIGTPINEQDGNYTLTLGDAGKMVRCNSATAVTYTVPPVSSVAYPLGTTIVIRNIGAGSLTIAQGTGVIIWKTGSGAGANVTMSQYGMATLILESSNWVIAGVGIA